MRIIKKREDRMRGEEIDVSDWSEVVVSDMNGTVFVTERTLLSKDFYSQLCKDFGYRLVSFQKGTNPYFQ